MATRKIEDEEMFFRYGIHVPSRTVYMGSCNEDGLGESGIDFLMADRIIKALMLLDRMSKSPITIIYNAPGGEWAYAISIYDCIKSLESPITIKGYGYIASAGTIIMQAAGIRLLSKNARWMIHDGYEGFEGIPKSFESWGDESKFTRRKVYQIYYDALKKKYFKKMRKEKALQIIEQWCGRDTIFSSQTAVNMGFADAIME